MPVAKRYENIEIVAGGGTTTILSTSLTEFYKIHTNGAVALGANVTITHDGAWVEGMSAAFLYTGSVTLGAFSINVFGHVLTQAEATAGNLIIIPYNTGGAFVTTALAGAGTAQIGTADLVDEAVTLAKMADLTRGSIIVGGAANRPTALVSQTNAQILIGDGTDLVSVAQTGDGAYNNAGLFGITALAITNGDISNTAGIEVLKLEAMSDTEFITGNTGSGNIATIVPMSADVLIANTGAATIQAGVVSPEKATTNLTDDEISVDVSFATGSVGGNFTTIAPCNGTILEINGTVTFLIEATNNGTVTPNIGGVAVTGGLVTFTAGDALNQDRAGTAVTATNTFTTGQEINLVTAKVTAGGTARMTIKYRKTS